jgi:hypothetical protein
VAAGPESEGELVFRVRLLRRIGWAGGLLLVVAVVCVSPSLGATHSGGAAPELTGRGQVLWQFEALLRDTFGRKAVFVRGGNFSCAGNGCGPLSVWSPYFFTFAGARGTRFHLAPRPAGSFGQHAAPVLVRGKAVACSASGGQFVIRYLLAYSFTVDCKARLAGG